MWLCRQGVRGGERQRGQGEPAGAVPVPEPVGGRVHLQDHQGLRGEGEDQVPLLQPRRLHERPHPRKEEAPLPRVIIPFDSLSAD